MGADITFKFKSGDSVYFRDSYNDSNLAWISGDSYWATARDGIRTRRERLAVWRPFFKRLAAITTSQIEARLENLLEKQDIKIGEVNELRAHFRKQRDFLKKLSKRFRSLDDIEASV